MSDALKTVKIKSTDPKSQGAFVEINESDFNPKVHDLFEPKAPQPVAAAAPKAPEAVADEPKATAEAVQMAADAGIDLASVVGTGKNGKITAKDVEAAIEQLTAPAEGE